MQRIKRLAQDGECCRPCNDCPCPPRETVQFFVESGGGRLITGGTLDYIPATDTDPDTWTNTITVGDEVLYVKVTCESSGSLSNYSWEITFDNGFGTNYAWSGFTPSITYCQAGGGFVVQFENSGDDEGIFLSVYSI